MSVIEKQGFNRNSVMKELEELITHISEEKNNCNTQQDYEILIDAIINDLNLIREDINADQPQPKQLIIATK